MATDFYTLTISIETCDEHLTSLFQQIEIPLCESVGNALLEQLQGDSRFAQCHITSSRLCANQSASAFLVAHKTDGSDECVAGIRDMSNIIERNSIAKFITKK